MGSYLSKTTLIEESIGDIEEPTLETPARSRNVGWEVDPRSPTVNIERTPIVVTYRKDLVILQENLMN